MKQRTRRKRAILRERRRGLRLYVPLRPLSGFEHWIIATGVFEVKA